MALDINKDKVESLLKGEILNLLKKAKFHKNINDIKEAIVILDTAKEDLQGVKRDQQSNRNDTSGDVDEIKYLYKYGNILYGVEEYGRALKYYKKLVDVIPSVNTYKALGDCFRKLKVYDEAFKHYQTALDEYEFRQTNASDKAAVLNSRGLTYMVKAADIHNYERTLYKPKMDYKNALEDFNEAIKISNKDNPNPLYLCNKGIILYNLNRIEDGLNCFKMAVDMDLHNCKTLTEQNINFIKNPLESFVKLEDKFKEIQPQFQVSQVNTKLLEGYYKLQSDHNELTELVKNYMIKQENINTLSDTSCEELKTKINQVETDLDQVKEDMQIQEKNLKETEAGIADIKNQLIDTVTKEEFDRLASISEVNYNMFDNKFRLLATEVNGVNQWRYYIDETLTEANIFLEVNTIEKFKSFEKESDEEIRKYATTFYWTLSNSLHAYRMISTDFINIKGCNYTGKVKTISEVLGAAGKIFPPLSIAGGIINVVNSFYDTFANVKLDRKARKVADILSGFLIEKDLSLTILDSAIEIAKAKEQIIKELETNEPETGVKKWLKDKVDKLASKITKIKGVPESKVSRMAYRDVSLFIIMSIALGDSEDNEILNKTAELLKDDVAIEHFKELYSKLSNKHLFNDNAVRL